MSEVLSDAGQSTALFVFLAKNVDQLVGVDVLVDLKLLDLVFELLEAFCFLVLVLVETLTVGLDFLHLLLELLDDFLTG